jgi:hypothetical protein
MFELYVNGRPWSPIEIHQVDSSTTPTTIEFSTAMIIPAGQLEVCNSTDGTSYEFELLSQHGTLGQNSVTGLIRPTG